MKNERGGIRNTKINQSGDQKERNNLVELGIEGRKRYELILIRVRCPG
jgi:hypothetical protein